MTRREAIAKLARDDIFGIDWDNVLKCRKDDACGDHFRMEECFDLPSDAPLAAKGVKICARVAVHGKGGRPKNRIVFRLGAKRATVDCVHTAITTVSAGEAEKYAENGNKMGEFVREIEGSAVSIQPEEHFKALRSYVAGIAEFGIANMYLSTYSGGDELPFGFNSAMRSQISYALRRVSPASMQDIVGAIVRDLRDAPRDWLENRHVFDILAERFPLAEYCAEAKDGAEACVNMFPTSPSARQLSAQNPNAKAETLLKIIESGDRTASSSILKRNELPAPVIARLVQYANGKDPVMLHSIAARGDLPPTVIKQLAVHGNAEIRMYMATKSTLPPGVMRQLAADHDDNIRCQISERGDLPEDVVAELSSDQSPCVLTNIAAYRHPAPVTAKLASSETPGVRINVANHITEVSPEFDAIKRKLAEDRDHRVRAAMASNKTAPPDVIERLLADERPDVEETAAITLLSCVRNCNTPGFPTLPEDRLKAMANVLDRLTTRGDLSERVALRIALSPDITPRAASNLAENVKSRYVLRNLLASSHVKKFYTDPTVPAPTRRLLTDLRDEVLGERYLDEEDEDEDFDDDDIDDDEDNADEEDFDDEDFDDGDDEDRESPIDEREEERW